MGGSVPILDRGVSVRAPQFWLSPSNYFLSDLYSESLKVSFRDLVESTSCGDRSGRLGQFLHRGLLSLSYDCLLFSLSQQSQLNC
jgi:hypothetical protein